MTEQTVVNKTRYVLMIVFSPELDRLVVLFKKHGPSFLRNKRTFPGGHIEEGESKKLEEEWAVHQVKTTANFAPRNKLISWYVGGLNFQVEHHLFPNISHVHYREVSVSVQRFCAEQGLSYRSYSWARALWKSWEVLRFPQQVILGRAAAPSDPAHSTV